MDKQAKYYTVSEVAKEWGVAELTVYRNIKAGKIPKTKVGRKFLIPAQYVDGVEKTQCGPAFPFMASFVQTESQQVKKDWPPKAGDPVLIKAFYGRACPAVSAGGDLVYRLTRPQLDEVKPFNPENIGKRWESI